MAGAVGKPGDSRSPGTGRKIAVAPSSAPCGGFSPHAAFPRLTPWATFLRPSGWLPSGRTSASGDFKPVVASRVEFGKKADREVRPTVLGESSHGHHQ